MDGTNKIFVIGSSNTDMVVYTDHFPQPGETILGGKFLMNPGGKGANQAVAAARLGGAVIFAGKTGADVFGEEAIEGLTREGIDTSLVLTDPVNSSGIAQITVNKNGENCIAVAPGANMSIEKQDIESFFKSVDHAKIALMQLEIPLASIVYAAQLGKSKGMKIILNPAPARDLPDELFPNLYMITPNETEAGFLTGIKITDEKSVEKAARILFEKGVTNIAITLGGKGAYFFSHTMQEFIQAPKVKAIDTTAAGDTFNGALAVALTNGFDLPEAVKFAVNAASIAVTRMGAQASIPFLNEIKSYKNE